MLYLCNVRDDRSRSSKGDLSQDKSLPFSAQKHSFRNAKRHIWRTRLKIFYSHPEGMKRERREREIEGTRIDSQTALKISQTRKLTSLPSLPRSLAPQKFMFNY